MDNHKLQMLHSSKRCDYRTPLELYNKLYPRFPFDIDLAATMDSALVHTGEGEPIYLGPDHPDPLYRDALKLAWHQLGRVGFLNPPYSLSMYSEGLEAGIAAKDLQWLRVENWAWKAYQESLQGFTTIGVFPYAAQTEWFRQYVMGLDLQTAKANGGAVGWSGHAAIDYWKLPRRVSFLDGVSGEPMNNANVNTCIVEWGPNPGFVGPWTPTGRYWDYR